MLLASQTKHRSQKELWQKTQYANLIRYVPSVTYFTRIWVQGKLLRKSLKTDALASWNSNLRIPEKAEQQIADNSTSGIKGKMTFRQAVAIYLATEASDH